MYIDMSRFYKGKSTDRVSQMDSWIVVVVGRFDGKLGMKVKFWFGIGLGG